MPRIACESGWCDGIVGVHGQMNDVRAARISIQVSRREFAQLVGVSVETLRAWDSGRRRTPAAAIARAHSVAAEYRNAQGLGSTQPDAAGTVVLGAQSNDADATEPRAASGLMSLAELARELGVSVYTLRHAARSGRLAVTYSTRVVFGRPVPLATLCDGLDYRCQYFGRLSPWVPQPTSPEAFPRVPSNYNARVLALRRRLRLTQGQIAVKIGAASKAVVYQWESRRRKPSPILWRRIEALAATAAGLCCETARLAADTPSLGAAGGVPAEFRNLWRQAATEGTRGVFEEYSYRYASSGNRAVALMVPRPIPRDDRILVGTISDLAKRV